jgi:hypothetical protein
MLALAGASLGAASRAAAQSPPQGPLQTGQHGTVISTGVDDPRYLLSFPAVQELVLQTQRAGSVPAGEAAKAVAGLPFGLAELERDGVLRKQGDTYRIAYMVLSVKDISAIYDAGQKYGPSLARAFIVAKPRFDKVVARYPRPDLKPDLLFHLVAGYILNWDGLRVGTELGMRAQPTVRPNGDRYILYSKERGPRKDATALYWGSHSSNKVGNIRLTTFGDAPSQPRLSGLPDNYFEVDAEQLKPRPTVYGAVNAQLNSLSDEILLEEGKIMLALHDGPKTIEQVRQATSLSPEHLAQSLAVLTASDYAELRDGTYQSKIITLTEADRPMVDEARELGREILTAWLKANYPKIRNDLAALDVNKAGVDFPYTFSEVWHYIFGFTTKELAERGFYTNPRAPNRTHVGFVPVVFQADLVPMP